MDRFQNGSLMKLKRKNGTQVWAFRWYDSTGDKRTYRKRIIGTVEKIPLRRDAEKAVLTLRTNINSGVRSPETVSDLIAHYKQHELTEERKAFASIETHGIMVGKYIEPAWGAYKLCDVRTVKVEEWLKSLPLAPASKTKIKSAFSVMFNHAIRYEWLTFNPIAKVRTSQKPLRQKDVLEPWEFQALLDVLPLRDRAMVLLAGSTGLRRSELVALTWNDVDTSKMEVSVTRAYVRSRFGDTKTDASRKPVPLHLHVSEVLKSWRRESPYSEDHDFLFPSTRLNGAKPLSPDSLLKRSIRPAVRRAGIIGKVIGWHNFRHSLATWLRALGVDIKVAQELMRHTNSKTTMDVYTRGNSAQKVAANDNVVELMLARRERKAS